jgi:hypothetical protein
MTNKSVMTNNQIIWIWDLGFYLDFALPAGRQGFGILSFI